MNYIGKKVKAYSSAMDLLEGSVVDQKKKYIYFGKLMIHVSLSNGERVKLSVKELHELNPLLITDMYSDYLTYDPTAPIPKDDKK